MSKAHAGASICCAQVATGGSSHEALPVLLLVPRLGDIAGGYSMLGYGDVVSPRPPAWYSEQLTFLLDWCLCECVAPRA